MDCAAPFDPDDARISVLLVEADARLAKLTARYLEGCGLVVTIVGSGELMLDETLRRHHDVILLDVVLPGRDGIDICRELRVRLDTPIIMVTARREEDTRVLGLDAGADDYVTKPYSSRELAARIRAVVRRARGRVVTGSRRIQVGALTIEPASMRVTIENRTVALTTYEFVLLKALAERAGTVLNREQLLELCRGTAEDAFERAIDVQISKVRHKLGDDARKPRYLRTIRGLGYMLAVPDDEQG